MRLAKPGSEHELSGSDTPIVATPLRSVLPIAATPEDDFKATT